MAPLRKFASMLLKSRGAINLIIKRRNAMKTKMMMSACVAACALVGCMNCGPTANEACDIVIYGSSPAAISAAIQPSAWAEAR